MAPIGVSTALSSNCSASPGASRSSTTCSRRSPLKSRPASGRDGDDCGHAVTIESPQGKQDRLERRSVQPLRVVDDQQQPVLVVGDAGQKTEDRGANREAVWRLARLEGQGDVESGALRSREVSHLVGKGGEQLDQTAKGDVVLGLDAMRGHHAHVACGIPCV